MGKKVLITGANGGFGKLAVNTLLSGGHEVAAAMREISGKNADAAKELEANGAHVIEIDVTDEQSVEAGVSHAIERLGGLNVIVNNAGVGVSGMQEHFTTADWQRVFDVNVWGVQRMNRAALPHLRAQRSGTIIYVSSLLGRIVLPFYGPYNASKWALEALAENYRVELSGFGIANYIVEPGGFETSFFGNLIQPSDQSRNESYGEFMNAPQQLGEGFSEALANNDQQDPQLVADAIVAYVEAEKDSMPFRTTVDRMGMGEPINEYNKQFEDVMHGIYSAFQLDNMLKVQ